MRAIQHACTNPRTPGKHTGRNPTMTEENVEELLTFVTANRRNRRMAFALVAEHFSFKPDGFLCSEDTICLALDNKGYRRRLARSKSPISEKNRRARLAWALEHVEWTPEQ